MTLRKSLHPFLWDALIDRGNHLSEFNIVASEASAHAKRSFSTSLVDCVVNLLVFGSSLLHIVERQLVVKQDRSQSENKIHASGESLRFLNGFPPIHQPPRRVTTSTCHWSSPKLRHTSKHLKATTPCGFAAPTTPSPRSSFQSKRIMFFNKHPIINTRKRNSNNFNNHS